MRVINKTGKIMAFEERNNNNLPKGMVIPGEFERNMVSDVVQRIVGSSRRHR
jgi:hypothetical protein